MILQSVCVCMCVCVFVHKGEFPKPVIVRVREETHPPSALPLSHGGGEMRVQGTSLLTPPLKSTRIITEAVSASVYVHACQDSLAEVLQKQQLGSTFSF